MEPIERRAFLAAAGGCLTALAGDAQARVERARSKLGGESAQAIAGDEDFWFQVRDAFTVDRNSVNLNSGSVSPAPRTIQSSMQQYWDITNMSPSYYVDEMLIPRVEVVRRRLADTFGCGPEEIAITRNTSEAMEIVQFGLSLKRGDEVLTTTQDYPRMLTTWRQREARDGIVLRTVPFPVPPESPGELVHRIERAITPQTRVILVCHVTYTTGQIFPVKEICRRARSRASRPSSTAPMVSRIFPFGGTIWIATITGRASTNGSMHRSGPGFCTCGKTGSETSGP